MKVKVAKWGNSVGLRVPKRLADDLGLVPGKVVDVEKKGTALDVETDLTRRKVPVYRIEDLLAQIKSGDKPPPFEDWGILPSEWPVEDWSDIAPTDADWEKWKREAEVKRAVPRRRRA